MKFLKKLFSSSDSVKAYAQPRAKTCPSCWEHQQYKKQNFALNQEAYALKCAFVKAFQVEYVDPLRNQRGIYYCRCCRQKYKYVE